MVIRQCNPGLINFPWYSRVNALENLRFATSGWPMDQVQVDLAKEKSRHIANGSAFEKPSYSDC